MSKHSCRTLALGCILFSGMLALSAGQVYSSDLPKEDFLRAFQWRNIGPANMGGRISDIQALDNGSMD